MRSLFMHATFEGLTWGLRFAGGFRKRAGARCGKIVGTASGRNFLQLSSLFDSNCLSSKCFWKVFNMHSASCAGIYILNKCVQNLSNTKPGLFQVNTHPCSGDQLFSLFLLSSSSLGKGIRTVCHHLVFKEVLHNYFNYHHFEKCIGLPMLWGRE